jgi:hypothetical protein
VLLVGNNRYELDLLTLGSRDRLDEGVLQLRTAAGWLPTAWEERTAQRFHIEVRSPRVRAAVDGEPLELAAPLELESLAGALRLVVPTKGVAMHDNPEASDEEQEEAHTGRQQEEESMRYPEHHDPDEQRDRAHRDGDEE